MLTDEQSKAVQEVAKTAGQSIKAAQDLGGFIAKYIGGSLDQAMGIWLDKLKYRRWENQINLAEKAQALLRTRGIDGPTRTLGLNLAIPLLEEASLADEEGLQNRWATLLANAADANQPEMRRAYVTTLAELTGFDALILDRLFDADREFVPSEQLPYPQLFTHYLPDRAIALTGQVIDSPGLRADVALSLANLGRLGLIDSAGAYGGLAFVHWVAMTELGRQFVAACRP